MNFVFLLFLHHLADVALQPTWLIKNKRIHAFSVFEHVMIYAGVLSLGLYVLGMFQTWMFFWFLIGHFIIDLYKYQYAKHKKEYWLIYPDQALHYLQIAVVWWLA